MVKNMEEVNAVITFLAAIGIKLLISIIIIIFTFKTINLLGRKLDKKLEKKSVDLTISRVLSSGFRLVLKVVIIACVVSYLGVETASISALIASIGVGISLAVQGTLSNFAGGVIIIIMRPFKIGDYIQMKEESGTVENIRLFYTHLVTPDNKMVLVPNGILANDVIVNYSAKDIRRCDLVLKVSYDCDIDLVKRVLYNACLDDQRFLNDYRLPFINVGNYSDSSIDVYVRVWVKKDDYWPVYYDLLDELKRILAKNGIEIPYNKLDVNIYSSTQL